MQDPRGGGQVWVSGVSPGRKQGVMGMATVRESPSKESVVKDTDTDADIGSPIHKRTTGVVAEPSVDVVDTGGPSSSAASTSSPPPSGSQSSKVAVAVAASPPSRGREAEFFNKQKAEARAEEEKEAERLRRLSPEQREKAMEEKRVKEEVRTGRWS
jgi:hypothetical protein